MIVGILLLLGSLASFIMEKVGTAKENDVLSSLGRFLSVIFGMLAAFYLGRLI